MSVLKSGTPFPRITVSTVGGADLCVPDQLAGEYAAVLFYRGSWCTYCRSQLRAFERAREKFSEAGVKVVALSVDDEATTADLVRNLGLTFPVGHSADALQLAYDTGAFIHKDPLYLESTSFVLDPEGNVMVSLYSSFAVGRLMPDDALGLIRYTLEHAPA
jgi:peroxiredoxin